MAALPSPPPMVVGETNVKPNVNQRKSTIYLRNLSNQSVFYMENPKWFLTPKTLKRLSRRRI
ncbi:hypothetical protein H5410_023231 [Solanum commersonii]|uniref:Uncharacterized protein n=1 Tax=Solanum commersonii TaxID=4109 RepID=A0A9J5ZJZ6_SOLCO|nr:hypothetical protein H5410_023231 [Solanum commersonii]